MIIDMFQKHPVQSYEMNVNELMSEIIHSKNNKLDITTFIWHTEMPGNVSVNWIIIGSGNGLAPAQHQVITFDQMLTYCYSDTWEHISVKFKWRFFFFSKDMYLKMSSAKQQSFCSMYLWFTVKPLI